MDDDTMKVIKGVHDARRYLEDREWVDKSVGVHIDALNDALALLKEQEAKPVEVCGQMFTVKYGHCPTCGKGMDSDTYPHWCGFCGQAVKWE